jgi:hypothetical protein
MVEIENTLVSEILFEKKFLCDLEACKGACCVQGDAGAPLEKDEVQFLAENIEKIKPYLRKEGIVAIEKEGTSVVDIEGDAVTTLVQGAECAYSIFDKKGTAFCGIEKAWEDGMIDFQKPISCHLYPIRITKVASMEALNYSKWEICDPACKLGELKGLKVYRFLKNSLERKYGKAYFKILEEVDRALEDLKK